MKILDPYSKMVQRTSGKLPKNTRAVLLDGVEYESIRAASRKIGIKDSYLSVCIRTKGTCRGHKVEYKK
jgi:hypothetical protein